MIVPQGGGIDFTNADFWADKVLDAIGVRNENQDFSHARHEEFEDRNVWNFYQAVTEALKTSPPPKVMEKHIALHHLLAPTHNELSVGRN